MTSMLMRSCAATTAGETSAETGPAAARRLAWLDARTVLPGMVPFGVLLGVTVVATGAAMVAMEATTAGICYCMGRSR